ncbi:Cytidylate kinase [Spirochaeta thermophila DSM 6578]|uniref:Cytidylate kinase n=1 Tax=Winmispira thermophila (strain ATCC 700085 / DSM 6578 / Z-1203) TaxID=869211 RepID=G0GEW9_WINT7|nr:cytidylate kinase family protein [Spirochaeta thermophila]AEJ61525.1 Cytidylate kinase [Spirochaeta thermophila DSM 6578]
MIVAISGKSGCGNSTVSRMVAERLGLRWINYTFRNISQEQGVPFEQILKEAQESPRWDLYLDERQKNLLQEGTCVLGSRLAIWLAPPEAFKVYLYAPLEVRARRIQKREGGRFEEILEETRERDRRDAGRYLALYGIDIDRYEEVADLVIDTTELTPEEITERIVAGVQKGA